MAGPAGKVQSRSRVFHHPPGQGHRFVNAISHHPRDQKTRVMRSDASSDTILAVLLQDACLKHQYIRSRDLTTIVERPERIRAVKAGLAVALSRLEGLKDTPQSKPLLLPVDSSNVDQSNPDDLAKALDQMSLETSTALPSEPKAGPIQVVHSSTFVDILNDAAVKFVHGDVDGDVYLERLKEWVANSLDKISKGESEIPPDLPQGDLYRKSSIPRYRIYCLKSSQCVPDHWMRFKER